MQVMRELDDLDRPTKLCVLTMYIQFQAHWTYNPIFSSIDSQFEITLLFVGLAAEKDCRT